METLNTIIGLGSPLLDLQAEVSQEFLQKYGLALNNTFFAEQKHIPLYDELIQMEDYHKVPGGSSLNTVRMSSWMLQGKQEQVKFVGCVGKDIYATMLIEETSKDNVTPLFDVKDDQPTGKCGVLLNNHDRCLVPLIGAAGFLSEEFVKTNIEQFKNATVLFSEVYFLYAKPELMYFIYETASQAGVKTCLTLSSVNAVKHKHNQDQQVSDMLEKIKILLPFVDFVFGNEDEFKQLGQNLGFEGSIPQIAMKIAQFDKKYPRQRISVCTQGKLPTIVATKDAADETEVILVDPAKIVDTNGAGDAFCGGYFQKNYYFKNEDYKKCALAGNYSAGQTIQHAGASLPKYKPEFA